MSRRSLAILPVLAIIPACWDWSQGCSRAGSCVANVGRMHPWTFSVTAAVSLLLSATLLAWLARMAWILVMARCEIRPLRGAEPSVALKESEQRTRVQYVQCLAGDRPLAFCAGALRPRIFVTRSLVCQLKPAELDAVLLHEEHHRRRRDPLRYAMRRAAADAGFYVPLLQWWAQHRFEAAELAADRAALQQAGRVPLAGALLAVGLLATSSYAASFAGAAPARVAQILGDALPRRYPQRVLWITSGIGLALASGTALCLAQVLANLR